jgi:hypothetical protein
VRPLVVRCTQCGKGEPEVTLAPNRKRLSGFDSYCTACQEKNRGYYRAARERQAGKAA